MKIITLKRQCRICLEDIIITKIIDPDKWTNWRKWELDGITKHICKKDERVKINGIPI